MWSGNQLSEIFFEETDNFVFGRIKVQDDYYAAGLHRKGSDAVFRYTSLELTDRYALLRAAFGV